MLKWLRKMGGGGAASQRTLLEEWLAGLDGGVARRVLEFILTGADEAVLAVIAADARAGQALGIKLATFGVGDNKLEAVFEAGLPDAHQVLRVAQVIEAAGRHSNQPAPSRKPLPPDLQAPPWLEPLLWEASTYRPSVWGGREVVFLSHDQLEATLEAGGARKDTVLRAVLLFDAPKVDVRIGELLARMSGLREAAARHGGLVREALAAGGAKRRARVLALLRDTEVDPGPFLDLLVQAAFDDSKSVREVGEAWTVACGERAAVELDKAVESGKPAARERAAELLARIRGAPPVAPPDALPPVEVGPLPRLGAAARPALRQLADAWHQEATKIAAASHAPPPPRPTDADLDEWLELMQSPRFSWSRAEQTGWCPGFGGEWRQKSRQLFAIPELTLGHLVRYCILASMAAVTPSYPGIAGWGLVPAVTGFVRSRKLDIGLRELGAELEAVGIEPRRLFYDLVFGFQSDAGPDWTDAQVAPFFTEHLPLLEAALGVRPVPDGLDLPSYLDPRSHALAAVARLPQPPISLQPLLWQLALGSARKDRIAARKCLVKLPGSTARVLTALKEGHQDEREAAAEWLREAGDAAAVPALKQALARAKSDREKATLMIALDALGVGLDDLVDQDRLAQEAAKGLAKGVPENLAWFPFDRLPPVRWSDGGAVDPAVVKWWLVQARKLGSPEPGPLLRCYAARLQARDAEALGRFVLEAWIAEDTRLPTEAEAQAKLQAAVPTAQQYAGWLHTTVQAYLDQVLASARATPVGSAIEDKGLLAVAGATAGEAAAPLVARYLKQWYGLRASQCKALVQMLAWVPHATAAAVLLATATRFRTAGIRKAAEAAVTALAERRGWTVDELADRTIPSADLEDDGTLELSFGPRLFRARLKPDLSLVVEDADGAALSGLPEPRAGDDAQAAAEAKQRLSASRKQLKTIEKQQRDRLYEAMCTQRSWRFEDWQTYLASHPVVRHLCARLVWVVRADGRSVASFRPLGDGTLTGPDDAAVTVPADGLVAVAHPCLLAPEVVTGWLQHLVDYEVTPLWDQLGRAPRTLPDANRNDTALESFEGHLVEAFKLRGRATRLGYQRGPSEDGGWFFSYTRNFPTVPLAVDLRFSGNGLPEENRTVALGTLAFHRPAPSNGRAGEPLALGEVPPVLLSECWNDLAAIAAEGTGYDPDWQRKIEP